MIGRNYICGCCGKGTGNTELHHIVKRSQATYMKNIRINLIELCQECHRGSENGVHNNIENDLKLKLQLQAKLFDMFKEKKFFSREEIQEKLNCTNFDTTLICKKLCLYRYGYEKEQIVRRLMGDKLYE